MNSRSGQELVVPNRPSLTDFHAGNRLLPGEETIPGERPSFFGIFPRAAGQSFTGERLSCLLPIPLSWDGAVMIEIMPEGSGNILGFRIRGKLTEADYRNLLVPEMEKAMNEYPKIRVVWVMEDFEGWTVGGAWEDFLLGLKFSAVEKMATVIDESWDEWMNLLFRAFTTLTRTELRFFKKERSADAWEWIRA